MLDLKDLTEKYSKATAGEWIWKSVFADWGFPYQAYMHSKDKQPQDNNDLIISGTKGTHECVISRDGQENPSRQLARDMDFIALAHNSMPELLAMAGRAQAAEKLAEMAVKTLVEAGHCTHYPGYTCDKDWPKACAKCIKRWLLKRGPAESEAQNV
jgi:hypothetical protein